MDDLITLVFWGVLILVGILSGRKKKRAEAARRQKPQVRVQRPPRLEAPRTARRPTPPRVQAERVPAPRAPARPPTSEPTRRKDLAEELMQFLQGQIAPEPERPAPPQPVAAPESFPEARSLEAAEPARAKSHELFHEKYMDEAPVLAGPKSKTYRRARLELNKKSLKHAFIMKEVLGPPKGLEP
jgi:type IV secretory pathway VirB10-like protein